MTTVHTSSIQSLPLLARGKVRDNYAVGDDRILMVASDRLSAFDVIMGEPIPGKGVILTQMALWWFDRLGHLCPNHLTGDAPESVVTPDEVPQVKDRSMLVKRLKPIPVEAVVRGYLAGSGWKEYQENRAVCGVPLPEGLTQREQAAAADLHARRQGRGGRARREHQLRQGGRDRRPRRWRSRSARPASRSTRRRPRSRWPRA